MENPIIHNTLEQINYRISKLESHFQADILYINGPVLGELVDLVRDEISKIRKTNDESCNKLCVILTTNGGDANATERIVKIMRHHYSEVEFLVPDHAYSAGTILCMSGDKIWMNYASVLGPIDPQVQNREGRLVPALGYLEKINNLIELARNNTISQAEFLILKDFDLAELSLYEQARDLTSDLLQEWLVKYKFKDWEKHKDGTFVTDEEKIEKAKEIAESLSNYTKWKSHARPLSIDVLKNMGLRINDFGKIEDVEETIMELYYTVNEYISLSGLQGVVLSRRRA